MPERFFLELADVARLLGRTIATTRLYVKSGQLVPAARTPRGVRLFRMADINAFRQEREAEKAAREQRGERLSTGARAKM